MEWSIFFIMKYIIYYRSNMASGYFQSLHRNRKYGLQMEVLEENTVRTIWSLFVCLFIGCVLVLVVCCVCWYVSVCVACFITWVILAIFITISVIPKKHQCSIYFNPISFNNNSFLIWHTLKIGKRNLILLCTHIYYMKWDKAFRQYFTEWYVR